MPGITALLVIDLQVGNFTCDPPIWNGEALLETVSRLIDRARERGAAVIFIQNDGPTGGVDDPSTPGWEIHPRIAPQPEDLTLSKSSPDAFLDTGLEEELAELGIERLVICGLQTEFCVDTTTRRAYGLGYEVILVSDGHSTWDGEILNASQIIAHHNSVLGGWFAHCQKQQDIVF
jgi:nicotinamidase-related amidase